VTDDENKPKRRRKPPTGFDTGYPEDAAEPSSDPISTGIPKKQVWSESKPATESKPAATESTPARSSAEAIPVPAPRGDTVPVESSAIESSHSASTSLSYPALRGDAGAPARTVDIASTPIPQPIPASASGWASESGPTASAPPASGPTASAPTSSAPTSPLPGATSGRSILTSLTSPGSSGSPPSPSGPIAPSSASGPIASTSSGPIPVPSSGPSTSGSMSSALVTTGGTLVDEPLLPTLANAPSDLREAIGAPAERRRHSRTPLPGAPADEDDSDDDDLAGGGKRRSRKMILVSIASLVVGLGVAALVFLGRANASYFYISCEPDQIVAQQGRSFPPWGETTLSGKQWAAIKIPPEAECIPLETEDETQLSDQFRTMLVKRASVLLTAKEVTKTDEANALLEQALLHARSSSDAARNARTDIQRLLGDVVYWRASLKMRDASKSLIEAAKQFDAAAQQRPRHVTDASAWADYVRKVVGELEAGPAGSTQAAFPPTPPPTEPRPPAPPGVALPVEPEKGSASEPPAPPPDAAMPTGGVLL
jgi:hypothetical protein